MGNRGKREFIQVLRLMETIPMPIVTDAVTEAIRLGAIGFDTIKLIALARIEHRPAHLDLGNPAVKAALRQVGFRFENRAYGQSYAQGVRAT